MSKRNKQRNLPRDVVERRADLYEKCESNYQLAWYRAMMHSARMHGDKIFDPQWDEYDLALRVKYAAAESELFVMTSEMMDLTEHAAQSLPPQTLINVDLPSPSGYLMLEKPFYSTDIRGKKNAVTSIMWREEIIGHGGNEGIGVDGKPLPKVNEGVVIYLLTDNLIEEMRPPWLEKRDLPLVPRDSLYNLMTISYGQMSWDIFPEDTANARDIVDQWNAMDNIHDGRVVEDHGEFFILVTASGHRIRVKPDSTVQFLKTAWHLMQSELSESTREFPPKKTMRGLPKGIPNSPITVVRLRRRKGTHNKAGKWTLDYRYLRRGHWRKQWYGSGESRYQREIYILPTIVGPEDGPFVDRDVVNLWDR